MRRRTGRNPVTAMLALLASAGAGGASSQTAPRPAPPPGSLVAEPVTGSGVELAVYEAGDPGQPGIVFIHGFSQNALTWERQFSGPLADRFHLVAYDLRGHGASEKPLAPDAYRDASVWADDLAAVIRDRGLERPILVGWSYGGYVIADYLRRYGDADLRGIVLVAAVTKSGTEEAAGFLTQEILSIFDDLLAPEVGRSLVGTRGLVDLWAEPGSVEWQMAFGSAMMVPPRVRSAMFSRVLDNDDVLARARVPTLVLHGAEDRIVRLSASEHTASLVPGARLTVYDGAGHAPHRDAFGRFGRDLAEFVGYCLDQERTGRQDGDRSP